MKLFPVCQSCERSYRPLTNGVYVLEVADNRPYKLWAADSLVCPGCGHVILSGFSNRACEHFKPGFADLVMKVYQLGTLSLEKDHHTTKTLAEIVAKMRQEELLAEIVGEL